MDRFYSSKVKKSQGGHNEKPGASGIKKPSPSGQSKMNPPSGNSLKREEVVTKSKTLVASGSVVNGDNTCDRVNSQGFSYAKPTTPAIKKPPTSQHKMTSCPVHWKPCEILAKTLSANPPVCATPAGTMVKPNTKGNRRSCTAIMLRVVPPPRRICQSNQTTLRGSLFWKKTIKKSMTISVKVLFTKKDLSPQESSSTITDDTTPLQLTT